MVSNAQFDEQTFALSDEERECFGWADVPIVLSTRTPEGRRCIPTREVTSTGQIVYGSIETMEAPPGVDEESWSAYFGNEDEPHCGALN